MFHDYLGRDLEICGVEGWAYRQVVAGLIRSHGRTYGEHGGPQLNVTFGFRDRGGTLSENVIGHIF